MKKRILGLLIALMVFVSCTEQELPVYGEENFIYLAEEADVDELYPSTSFNFFFQDDDLTSTVVEIPVLVTGKFTGSDRTFTLQAVDSLSTGVAGTHYEILNEANVIPDQAVGGTAYVRINRHADLETADMVLTVALVDDQHFSTGINVVYQVVFNDYFSKPEWWPVESEVVDWVPNIGPFTIEKALLWLEFYGIEDGSDPWCCMPYWDGSYNSFIEARDLNGSLCNDDIDAFQFWLAEMETECGCELLDENGDRILDTMEYD